MIELQVHKNALDLARIIVVYFLLNSDPWARKIEATLPKAVTEQKEIFHITLLETFISNSVAFPVKIEQRKVYIYFKRFTLCDTVENKAVVKVIGKRKSTNHVFSTI